MEMKLLKDLIAEINKKGDTFIGNLQLENVDDGRLSLNNDSEVICYRSAGDNDSAARMMIVDLLEEAIIQRLETK